MQKTYGSFGNALAQSRPAGGFKGDGGGRHSRSTSLSFGSSASAASAALPTPGVFRQDGKFQGWLLARTAHQRSVWKTHWVVLDALNLTLYQDEDMVKIRSRIDVYEAAKEITTLEPNVFSIRFAAVPFGWEKKTFLFHARDEVVASLWIEAIYQARAFRMSWSLSSCLRIERFLCCCVYGEGVLAHLYMFSIANGLAVTVSLISDGFDLASSSENSSGLKSALSFANNLLSCAALLSYFALIHNSQLEMKTTLRRARGGALFLIIAYSAEVAVSVWSYLYEDHDEVGQVLRHRLQSFIDVAMLAMWLNGVYLCTWGLHILNGDVTGYSLSDF